MSKALIVSYCWTQDAKRLGALINGDGTGKSELIDLVLRDVAAVHGVTVDWLKQFYEPGDYFAWDWLHDPLTMGSPFLSVAFLFLMVVSGAFRFFGPDVYGNGDVYSEILHPVANGKLFIAGEATGSCHAYADSLTILGNASDPDFINSWVGGALDSAWRAVDQYLALNHPESVRQEFWDLWGPTEYLDEASNKELVDLNRELAERHLVIALHKSGVMASS